MSTLSKSVLQNTFNSKNLPESMEVGDFRAKMFLYKVKTSSPFKLVGGEEVYVSYDSPGIEDILNILKRKKVDSIRKFIVASDCKCLSCSSSQIPISKFEKTIEFGSRNQTTGGSTEDVEELTALFCALRTKVGKPLDFNDFVEKFQEEKLNNLRVSKDIDDIVSKAKTLSIEDPWLRTYILTANILAEEGYLLPGMEIHRESNYVRNIYQLFKNVNERYSDRNKWSPADIWLRRPGFELKNNYNTLEELNRDLLRATENRDLVGVSLKALGKEKPIVDRFNFNLKELDISHRVTLEDLKNSEWLLTANTSNALKVGKYKIVFRCSTVGAYDATSFVAEVSNLGAVARNGKAGLSAINYELKKDKLPSIVELHRQYPEYSGAQLSKLEANLFYERFMRSSNTDQLRIVNGLLDYAMSKTSDASAFIKVH